MNRRLMRPLPFAAIFLASLAAIFIAGCDFLQGNPAAASARGLRSAMRRWNSPPIRCESTATSFR